MHKKVISALLEFAPKKIIYISCNPITQAQDMQLLSSCYKVEKMQMVDMFPNTNKIENIISLLHK